VGIRQTQPCQLVLRQQLRGGLKVRNGFCGFLRLSVNDNVHYSKLPSPGI
jgi:hypothetical protein